MTHDELQAIKARAEAATPGPWTFDIEDWKVVNAESQHASSEEDWQFIAHARTDVPALVAEVERLRELGEALTKIFAVCDEAVEKMTQWDGDIPILFQRHLEAAHKALGGGRERRIDGKGPLKT